MADATQWVLAATLVAVPGPIGNATPPQIVPTVVRVQDGSMVLSMTKVLGASGLVYVCFAERDRKYAECLVVMPDQSVKAIRVRTHPEVES